MNPRIIRQYLSETAKSNNNFFIERYNIPKNLPRSIYYNGLKYVYNIHENVYVNAFNHKIDASQARAFLTEEQTYEQANMALLDLSATSSDSKNSRSTEEQSTQENFDSLQTNRSGEQEILINWEWNGDDPDSFEILKGTTILSGLTVIAGDERVYIDSSISYDVTYTYQVRAIRSGQSVATSDTSSKSIPSIGFVDILPGIPVGFTAIPGITTDIQLYWNKGSGGEPLGYQIYRSTNNTKFSKRAATTGATFYRDRRLDQGITYYYKIDAYNSGGQSDQTASISTMIRGLPPSAPMRLQVEEVNQNSTTLSWDDTSLNENSFKIYYRTAPQFTGITPSAPTGFTAIDAGTNSVTLQWTDTATNEDGFLIYYRGLS